MTAILSLDVGGTKMAASVLLSDGTLLSKIRVPSRAAEGPDAMIARLIEMAREAITEAGSRVEDCGISVGGPLDPVAGVVLSPPNLPGWDRIPLARRVAGGLGMERARVRMDNDANACVLAEQRFGAARGRSDAIFLTLSTGLGAGMILGGRLHRGATFNAGEAGHQVLEEGGPRCGCGQRGCLEAFASGSGIAARLRERWDDLPAVLRARAGRRDGVSAGHLLACARDGDAGSLALWDETVRRLARGVANLVYILNPEIVILGTIAWHAGDFLLEPLRRHVNAWCWPSLTHRLEIVATPLGPRLQELSGLAVALEPPSS
jgi:glucokinase